MAKCEDLATKAELQELRDQLNEALGDKIKGGKVALFEKDKSPLALASLIPLTLFGLATTNAPKAIIDIVTQASGSNPFFEQLASGSATLKVTKGTGIVQGAPALDQFTKVTGQSAAGTAAATKSAAGSAAGVSVLANLVNLAGTLAINIATVKILDKRIDAEAKGTTLQIDAAQNSMISLYEKNQGDIDAVNADLADQANLIAENKQNNAIIATEITAVQNANRELADQFQDAQTQISDLQAQNQQITADVAEYQIEFGDITNNLTKTIDNVEEQLGKAVETIELQKQQISSINEEIEYIKIKIRDFDERLDKLETATEDLRLEFQALREDLAEDVELIDARSKLNSAKLIILQSRASKGSSGGVPAGLTSGTVEGLNKILELTSGLANSSTRLETITSTDLFNDTNKFKTQFDKLLPQVEIGNVNQQQLDTLKTDLGTDFKQIITQSISSSITPTLTKVESQTSPINLAKATETGICQSLNNGACSATPNVPNPTQGLKGFGEAIADKIDDLDDILDDSEQEQYANILEIVRDTNNAVRSSDFGLEKTQDFLETAWETTTSDKVLLAVNTAYTLHNSALLSNSLKETMSEVGQKTLSAINIDKFDGDSINNNADTKKQFDSIIRASGVSQKNNSTNEKIAPLNNIYQATGNLLYNIRLITDGSQEITEMTRQDVAYIGNALRGSGTIREDAYELMAIEFSSPLRPINTLKTANKNTNIIEELLTETKTNSEQLSALETNQEKFEKELEIVVKEETRIKTNSKKQALAVPTPTEEDELRDITND